MNAKFSAVLALAAALGSAVPAAELRLHSYFTDNMVLQRDQSVVVKGWADAGEKVALSFAGQQKSAVADKQGRWRIALDPMPASAKGSTLTCRGAEQSRAVTIGNVVIGDVFLFGRETSIDVSLGRNEEGRKAAAEQKPAGSYRALHIRTVPATAPQDDLGSKVASGWTEVSETTALPLSAAAYYLGRDLARELSVPIGIVDIDMGAYFAIGWLSDEALRDSLTLYPENGDMPTLPQQMVELREERDNGTAQKELDELSKRFKGRKPVLGIHPLENPMYPSAGYNAVIHPLKGMAFKGILLQLGNDYPFIPYSMIAAAGKGTDKSELAAAWYYGYDILKKGFRITPATLPLVPRDWRRAFGNEKLPIGLIMPPGSDLYTYALHNREVRELQRRMHETTPGLGLIMPGTENIPFSGQPADDTLLAERCRHWVLGAVCGRQDVAATGPLLARVESRLSEATVFFREDTARGLEATDNALDHFEVAGPDQEYVAATARIEGSTVRLKSDKVNNIRFVRYNWLGKPGQGLVNSAGLPALPFTTLPDWVFSWIVPNSRPELPPEYHTPACDWKNQDVAIINGSLGTGIGDSVSIPRWIGPTGIFSDSFGPNIAVIRTEPGSPAHGKVLPGDMIYGVNGKVFGSDTYRELAAAITYSESEAAGGKLILGIRRKGRNLDVELQLEVLGSYSSTTPYYCPKSEKIVARAEEYVARKLRPGTGMPSSASGFLDTDILFLLAAGTPEYQGLVRRVIYAKMAKLSLDEPDPNRGGVSNWGLGYNALLLGEYYHATGDRNVLPYMQNLHDWMVVTQIKPPTTPPSPWEWATSEDQVGGWRQKYHAVMTGSTYGLMPHAGMACMIGMELAKEAGLHVDELAYQRGLTHFRKGRAEHAFVLYSYAGLRRPGPAEIDPDLEAEGRLSTMNGKLGTAAALFSLVDDRKTVEICSRYCVYAFNRTRSGHGGMFFNNFWTPIGAHAAGEKGFRHFMAGQTWWRELYRRYDGSFTQDGRGGIGAAYALHRVAPRKGLRILGAPRSAFGANPPAYLEPALDAHRKRNYALSESLILKELKERLIPPEDRPVIDHLLHSVRTLRKSIEHDLALVEDYLKEGKYYYAEIELPQLRGVVAEDDPRLKAVVEVLESPAGAAQVRKHRQTVAGEAAQKAAELAQAAADHRQEEWLPLVASERNPDPRKGIEGVSEEEASTWRMKVIESMVQAPEGWMRADFNDGDWDQASLPLTWRMYHTVLFRGNFTVADKAGIDALRIQGRFFQQLNAQVYINETLVAKIDDIGRGAGVVTLPLTDLAVEVLKQGENTIAVKTRHNRRWGAHRGLGVGENGFAFWLDAKKK